MRNVKYKLRAPVGSGRIPKKGDLIQFLEDLPASRNMSVIPPLHVLNDLFSKGVQDAGMSGGSEWEPFQISDAEWQELREVLERLPKGYKFVEPADWVKNEKDWLIWRLEYQVGVPSDRHRELSAECEKWENLRDAAEGEGKTELAKTYGIKQILAAQKLSEYVTPYLMKHREKKDKGG